MGFQNRDFVLREDGILVPKHVGDAASICVLNDTVQLVGVTLVSRVLCQYYYSFQNTKYISTLET
jgi:hypothetical protein